MAEKLNWGILGAGNIAKQFCRGVTHSKTGRLVAVGSRDQEKAKKFAGEFAIPTAYGSYETLLADKNVQAVYIATPHPMHARWAIAAAEAGKHLLVEKPIGLNAAEAMAIIDAAERHGVFLMEAYMYRCHPLTARLVELVKQKVIGEVRMIQATFSFQSTFNPQARLWNNALGGGGILDVGGYPVSLARLVAGAAASQDFADPESVSGAGRLHPETGIDEYAAATLKFASGIVAQVATGVGLNQDNTVRVFGTEGSIVIPSMWIPARESGKCSITVNRKGKPAEEVVVETDQWLYGIEADTVTQYLDRKQAASPAMSWNDTLGNARTLDQWRASIGLTYEAEKPQNYTHTVTGRPLKVCEKHTMPYGKIRGLDKPVARLVMGVDNQTTMPHLAIMFDDYFQRGGNCFDTAFVYGELRSRLFGQWVRNRGIREQVVVIAKGAHTPLCDPKNLKLQIDQQLQWYGLDYADIYMMHRDNPQIPVGEFVEAMNDKVKEGKIRVFGGSNWSLQRVDEANAYAKAKGLQGFSVVSNNFSLARMVKAPWAGCIQSTDVESRAWFKRTGMALLPWSSQARGFFVPERAHPDKREDASLVESWYSDDNFKRQARTVELARKYGVEPINIALAWVLCQPFETFPLIGPRTLQETRSSLRALPIKLTEREMKYLNLED